MDESFVASSNHILLLIDPGWGELETIAASSEKESNSSSRRKAAKRKEESKTSKITWDLDDHDWCLGLSENSVPMCTPTPNG